MLSELYDGRANFQGARVWYAKEGQDQAGKVPRQAYHLLESENAMQSVKDRLRRSAWGARLNFAAVLLVCSEWIVWQ